MRPGRNSRPSRCFDRRAANARADAASRNHDGARGRSDRSQGLRVDRLAVEERGLGYRNSSVPICVRRRRIEGDQEQKQCSAFSGACHAGASPLARAHAVSLRRRLGLCQSSLPWLDTVHLSHSLPASHSTSDRTSLWIQEQQASSDRVAHASPFIGDTADFERREREGRAIAASAHYPEDNPGALRTSGFGRPTESPQKGRPNGASDESLGKIESEEYCRVCRRIRVSIGLGVPGCPKPDQPKSPNCFEMMVSAAGLEPATHALKVF